MYSVLKGAGYFIAHAPEMVLHNGTTQTTQRKIDPSAEYLSQIVGSLRSYEDCLSYMPNQVYIGNMTPEELKSHEQPWYGQKAPVSSRFGKYGEIMPEDEFIGMMKICDVFDLVKLDAPFSASVKAKLGQHPLVDKAYLPLFDKPEDTAEIASLIASGKAEPVHFEGKVVGCIRFAHEIDENLSAHVIFENLVSKASCVLSILHLIDKNNLNKDDIDYVIECSEEACGDMNQRGGGNFAKAAAEFAGLTNATGSDVRGFCAGPTHALILAASLVGAGTCKNVVVAAGGSTAKLGMNGRDHVKKGIPILEDGVAGFAALVSRNDGVSPEFNTDIVGRHTVGTGSSPQRVIESLTSIPLGKAGFKLTDIDKYSVEMQNPDITKPAGAGNVPEANYKMIGALAAMRGDIEKAGLADFVEKHGMVGWAPTQGHIPSGVPYLGFARQDILDGKLERAMIVGKGSLFLGRMTNLFDGVSIVLQKNSGKTSDGAGVSDGRMPIAVTALGSELGEDVVREAACRAADSGIFVKLIGSGEVNHPNVESVVVSSPEEGHKALDKMLGAGEAKGGVTMHYPFPIGVSTVGRIVTPAQGKSMYIATTTGTSATDRVESMVRNALYGVAAAKACGVQRPTVGILNVDGARQAEKALLALAEKGYDIAFASSGRSDGGAVMRGNDLITAACDVMVTDPLTGNVLMKIFSSFTSGGSYETVGYGYGPGMGEGFGKLVLIVSRASGVPVIQGAIEYAAELVRGNCAEVFAEEMRRARAAGLDEILRACRAGKKSDDVAKDEVTAPPKEVVVEEIVGIEILDLETAVRDLWKEGLYAESGMGCTGPMILVSEANHEKAKKILVKNGYIKP